MLLDISPRQRRPFNRLRRRFLGVNLEIKVRHVAPGFALRVAGGDVGVGVDLGDGDVNHAPFKIIKCAVKPRPSDLVAKQPIRLRSGQAL